MPEPAYRQALLSSWQLVWHHKLLWLLGALAMLAGQFGLGDFAGKLWMLGVNLPLEGAPWWLAFGRLLWYLATQVSVLKVLWLTIILGSVAALLAFIAVSAQGALIATAGHWYQRKKILSLADGWRAGARRFWPLLLLNVLQKILLAVLLLAVVYLWRAFTGGSGWGALSAIFVLAAALFLALLITAVLVYSAAYLIIDQEPLGRALARGYHLFSHHLLVSLEVGALLTLLGLLVLVFLAGATAFAFIPSLILWLLAAVMNSWPLMVMGWYFGLFVMAALIVAAGGFYNAFTVGAWVYCFKKMHDEGVMSRLLYYLRRLARRD